MTNEQIELLLATVPEKGRNGDPNTVSRKFKRDLIEFFSPLNLHRCVEVSSFVGNTTFILSHLFDSVLFIERHDFMKKHWNIAKNGILKDRHNVTPIMLDAYNDKWPFTDVDVFFIDCAHFFGCVCQDIDNAKTILNPGGYLIFDDWGLPLGGEKGVQKAILSKNLNIVKYIGEKIKFNEKDVFQFEICDDADYEGVIVQVN